MKLIKINPDHYVIVDDSEIKEGDWFLNTVQGEVYCNNIPNYNVNKEYLKKITHSTKVEIEDYWKVIEISLSEIKELIGEVDVEKKAIKYATNPGMMSYIFPEKKEGYITGYNQALEDNKDKKYTEEDVIRIVKKSRLTGLTTKYLFLSLQPKTEWEVEFVDGKLKLK